MTIDRILDSLTIVAAFGLILWLFYEFHKDTK